MDLKDILYVSTIAKTNSFTKASEQLHISQPALSQIIKRLERDLHVSLFDRERNSIKLTKAGEIFVEDGAEILRLSNSLENKMVNFSRTEKDVLRLGISIFYSKYHLPHIIPAFKKTYTNIDIELIEDISFKLEQHVLDDAVDICMVPFPLEHKGLDYEILYHEQILFAMPKNYHLMYKTKPTNSKGLPFIDLRAAKNEPFVFLKKQRFTTMGLELCKTAGFTPDIVYETTNWDTVNSLIASGMGVGLVPEIFADNLLPPDICPAYFRILGQNSTRPYVLAYKKKSLLSPKIKGFIEICKEVFLKRYSRP